MRKAYGVVARYRKYTLRKWASWQATVQSKNDLLRVVRPTMKQAILAATRLMKKLGWELAEPWERLP